jgi:trigger factor
MTAKVTVDGPCRRTLSFSVDRTELDSEVASQLAEIASRSNFKGFRKGKAPAALVARTHGASVREDARRKIMSKAFADAIKTHGLHPVGDPEMNLAELEDEKDGDFTFEFAIEVIPDIELALPERFGVDVTIPDLDDGMVDTELERLRERFGSIEEAEEGALVASGDILEGTATYVIDGVEIEPRSERPAFTKHNLVDGMLVEGSAEVFEGASLGDVIELAVELPAHFDPTEHAGKSATLKYTVDRHRLVVLPELDEELLGKLQVASVDELRTNIQNSLQGQRQAAVTDQANAAIEDQLLEAHSFELPSRLEARSIDRRVHEIAHRLVDQQGLSSEEGHHRAEEQREQIAESTRRSLRLAFLYSRIGAAHDLEAKVEEAVAQVRTLAQEQGQDPEAALQASVQEGWLGDVQEQLTNDKVRAWLRERTDVTEQAPPAAEAG